MFSRSFRNPSERPRERYLQLRPENVVVPIDPIRALIEHQLQLWNDDPEVRAAQLYLKPPLSQQEPESSRIGDGPTLSETELESLFQRAADTDEKPGFEANFSGQRGHVYPLLHGAILQGAWLLFPAGHVVDWAKWKRDSFRFSQELFALSHPTSSEPPTFSELAVAFPDEQESAKPSSDLHWEQSRARVEMTVEDELSHSLLVDHLPIF